MTRQESELGRYIAELEELHTSIPNLQAAYIPAWREERERWADWEFGGGLRQAYRIWLPASENLKRTKAALDNAENRRADLRAMVNALAVGME